MSNQATNPTIVDNRVAYSLAEFASLFGKTVTWAHRLVYARKIRVLQSLGRMLVPASEVDRLLNEAAPISGRKSK